MITTFAFIDIASPEILLLLVVVAFLFGGKKVSEASRSIGGSIRNVKKEVSSISTNATEARNDITGQMSELKTELKTAVDPIVEKTPPKI